MKTKGLITAEEYDGALKDVGDSMGTRSANSSTLTVGSWKSTFYGYIQADMMYHSTQSFPDYSGNIQVARPDTLAGQNGRFTSTIRDSRFGIRIQAPALGSVHVTGLMEMDFLGPTGTIGTTVTEGSFFVNPNFRVRHAYLKVETPVVDILFGQYWDLFGYLPTYLPAIVQWPGLPGQLFARTTQLRLSHNFKSDYVNVELSAAAVRAPQRDSGVPEGQGGLRMTFNKWTAWHTGYLTGTGLTPASIAVSGDVRAFKVPEFTAKPEKMNKAVGSGIAVSVFLPIVPATKEKKDNSLSLLGEFVTGKSINDLYTGLTGGVANARCPTRRWRRRPRPTPPRRTPASWSTTTRACSCNRTGRRSWWAWSTTCPSSTAAWRSSATSPTPSSPTPPPSRAPPRCATTRTSTTPASSSTPPSRCASASTTPTSTTCTRTA